MRRLTATDRELAYRRYYMASMFLGVEEPLTYEEWVKNFDVKVISKPLKKVNHGVKSN